MSAAELPETKRNTAVPQSSLDSEHVMIDKADRVDVASFDSFPASDAPAWIASGIGSQQSDRAINTRRAPARTNSQTPNEKHYAAAT